jgi:hypothetical protein
MCGLRAWLPAPRVEDLSDEAITALAGAKMDSRHDHLDALMRD